MNEIGGVAENGKWQQWGKTEQLIQRAANPRMTGIDEPAYCQSEYRA